MLVVDNADQQEAVQLRGAGLRVMCTSTVMRSAEDRRLLAEFVLNAGVNAQTITA